MTNQEIIETYINGNISDAKAEIKKMSKRKFYQFIKMAIENGITDAQLERLIS